MKLQEYVDTYRDIFLSLLSQNVEAIVKQYAKQFPYTDFDKSFLWYLFRYHARIDNFKLDDEMRERFNCKDSEIYTMIKRAFCAAFGELPHKFLGD